MNAEFLIDKIKKLSDEKLRELISMKTNGNKEIIMLAEEEATRRGIDLAAIRPRDALAYTEGNKTMEEDGTNWMLIIADFLHAFA